MASLKIFFFFLDGPLDVLVACSGEGDVLRKRFWLEEKCTRKGNKDNKERH